MKHESTNEPVAYALFIGDRLAWDSEWAFSNESFPVQFDDEECRPLYTHPQDQKKDEALRLALKELKTWQRFTHGQNEHTNEAITLIEQALENK